MWIKLYSNGTEIRRGLRISVDDNIPFEKAALTAGRVPHPAEMTIVVCMEEDADEIGETLARAHNLTYVK